jgi:Tol biopolymer transport system component
MPIRTITGAALVVGLALTFPTPAAAQAPAKKKPTTGTIGVVVKGLPAKQKTKVTVSGPRNFTKIRKTPRGFTLTKVRPGEYVASGKTFKFKKRYYSTSNASGWVGKGKTRVLKLVYKPSKVNPDAGPEVKPKPFDAVSAPAGITLVSHNPAGAAGNQDSAYPSYAPDGSLFFSSCATDLTGDTDACFAYRTAGESITRIPQAFLGTDIIDWGGQTVVSPDGTKLGFTTLVRLVPNDFDDAKDLYSLTLSDGSLARVSQTSDGSGMTGGDESPNAADAPTWGPDSARMAFITQSTNLAPKNDWYDDLFVKTLGTGSIVRAGVGRTIHHSSWSPGGDSIAFDAEDEESFADVEVDSNIYIVSSNGGSPWKFTTDNESFDPAWSPDGARIAFASNSPLVAGDDNETGDIYVKDVASGALTRISVDSSGKQTGWSSSHPVWSRDGSKIAFVAEDGDYGQTVLVKNLASGTMTQVFDSVAAGGGNSDFTASGLTFSPDGGSLAFDSDYPRITGGDANKAFDVFVATL